MWLWNIFWIITFKYLKVEKENSKYCKVLLHIVYIDVLNIVSLDIIEHLQIKSLFSDN